MGKCVLSGKGPQTGNSRPWSKKATRRHWQPNLQKVTIYEPELGRSITLRASARALKSVNKVGLAAYLRKQKRSLQSVR